MPQLSGTEQDALVKLLVTHIASEGQLDRAMLHAGLGKLSDFAGNGSLPAKLGETVEKLSNRFQILEFVVAVLEHREGLNGNCPPIKAWLTENTDKLSARKEMPALALVPRKTSQWGPVLALAATLVGIALILYWAMIKPKRIEGHVAGEVRSFAGIDFVWCPAGTFTMGSPKSDQDALDNEPREHKVEITRGFWLGSNEVTQKQWTLVIPEAPWTGKQFVKEGPDYPVTYVSWRAANEFCKQMTAKARDAGDLDNEWEFALPTEAQWEYACRAGQEGYRYSFVPPVEGREDELASLSDYAWFVGNSGGFPNPVHRQSGGNAWQLFDMHGNVWEWCQDAYQGEISGRHAEVSHRVIRGGGFMDDEKRCRSAARSERAEDESHGTLGFRLSIRRIPK